MTLKECYDALGGNYEDTVRRLYNEKLVEKFLFKFEEDPSFENLKKALEEEDLEAAFRAAHTLKVLHRTWDLIILQNQVLY